MTWILLHVLIQQVVLIVSSDCVFGKLEASVQEKKQFHQFPRRKSIEPVQSNVLVNRSRLLQQIALNRHRNRKEVKVLPINFSRQPYFCLMDMFIENLDHEHFEKMAYAPFLLFNAFCKKGILVCLCADRE